MIEDIASLSNERAFDALTLVVTEWFNKKGMEAYLVIDTSRNISGIDLHDLPQWLLENENITDELGETCKFALSTIYNGDDPIAHVWAEKAIQDVKESKGQCLDPVSLGIVGATIIGIILAARVKKIGAVEFYEGVPDEVVEIVKAATSVSVPSSD